MSVEESVKFWELFTHWSDQTRIPDIWWKHVFQIPINNTWYQLIEDSHTAFLSMDLAKAKPDINVHFPKSSLVSGKPALRTVSSLFHRLELGTIGMLVSIYQHSIDFFKHEMVTTSTSSDLHTSCFMTSLFARRVFFETEWHSSQKMSQVSDQLHQKIKDQMHHSPIPSSCVRFLNGQQSSLRQYVFVFFC
jgi:hypothetical protein